MTRDSDTQTVAADREYVEQLENTLRLIRNMSDPHHAIDIGPFSFAKKCYQIASDALNYRNNPND